MEDYMLKERKNDTIAFVDARLYKWTHKNVV